MCVSKTTNQILLIVLLFVEIFSLEVVPLEKNIILNTEYIIRNVTNDIFVELRLKGIKNNTKIQQHNLVHNFFTTLGVADQHTLAAVKTVSRFDKTNINNKTLSFMDILNELLQEDWINDEDNSLTSNINVLKFVKNYLSGENYENNADLMKHDNFNEVIDMLESELAEENLVENSDEDSIFGKSNKNDTSTEFWKPGPSGRRIYQGTRTHIKQYPFMASIQIFHSFQCGGSIVRSDLILTAASCLQLAYNNRFFRENPAFLSVRVGSDFYQGGGDNIEALEVYFEPSYDPKTLRHNLALIRLQRHINFRKTKRVKKIELDRKPHNVPFNAGPLTIVGWGARTSSNILDNPWTNRLSYADMGLYHYRDCEDIYSKEFVTRTNFCAGSAARGSGACNKDAGDPGIIAGILVGVASFGSPACGTPDAPTVFTKVGFYADWIDEIMEQRVPTRNKFTTTKRPQRPHTPDLLQEYHRLTRFTVTPVLGTMSPMPINKVDNTQSLLRNKKRDQDADLEDMLYNMMGDKNTNPNEMRDKIQKMLPKIKKYATTTTPTTTEMFITTDIANQKHTVIDKMINEDVDLNIAKIIDKLDIESSGNVQEQLLFEMPDKKKGRGKKIEPELIDIPDLGEDVSDGGSMEFLREIPKEAGVTGGIVDFDQGPIDDSLSDRDPARLKKAKIVRQRKHQTTGKVAKMNKLEPKKQDLNKGKLRDIKQDVKRFKIPEGQNVKQEKLQPVTKNIKKGKTQTKKSELKKEIKYEDKLGAEKSGRQLKRKDKVTRDKPKQTPLKAKNNPVGDHRIALDDALNGVLGNGLGSDLGAVDDDGYGVVDDGLGGTYDGLGGINDELAGINDGQIDKLPINQGKNKIHAKGDLILENNKEIIQQYDEFDYIPTTPDNTRHDKKAKNKETEEILTLLYLSSEENQKGMTKNIMNDEEKEILEPSFNNLIDFDNADDGLDAEDEFSLPLKNNATQTLYESLPKEKLYDLLSEAIDDLTSKKRKNS